ncbi:signal peptidase I [Vagococcus sp.]|uniref:signal peptidase I n=1 Tax=Vagococcus sp. TaxID=1933889 RepID=UPI003F943FBF
MNAKPWIKDLLWYVGLIIVLILLKVFVFTSVIVSGDSMNPTLVDRERIISLKMTKIDRFDIVTFPAPDEPSKKYIKRVIGMPGDTIEYKDDQLYLNGKIYKEPYLDELKKGNDPDLLPEGLPVTKDFTLEEVTGQTKVPEGHYFVMGDNRQNSKDSRMIGFIDEATILGDVKFSFWPVSKWGLVK